MKRRILVLALTLILASAAPCAASTIQGNTIGEPSNFASSTTQAGSGNIGGGGIQITGGDLTVTNLPVTLITSLVALVY